MSLALISTTCRHTPVDKPSGTLYVFDIGKKEIVRRCEIIEPPYREVDPNPRGGFRGLKGISIDQDRIAIANASTVFIYDHLWNPLNYFWHPSCAGIHDISLQDNLVWATSSRNDLLLCLDFDGKVIKAYDLRKYPTVKQFSQIKLSPLLTEKEILEGKIDFRDPRTHDNAFTDSLHVNSFERLKNGDLLISCGLFKKTEDFNLHKINHKLKRTIFADIAPVMYRFFKKIVSLFMDNHNDGKSKKKNGSFSVLLRVSQNGKVSPSLVLSGCTVPSHSIRLLFDGSAIYLNTTTGEIIHFDPIGDQVLSAMKIGTKFLRGATQLPDSTLLVGDNNQVIHFNLKEKEIITKTSISENTHEAIFDIAILPKNFILPPESFIKHHENKMPIVQK